MYRTGLGLDTHRLVPDRPLLVGGVRVEAPVGADAHSDGDVLLHALCDALFGAIGSGDIGEHFPDTDPRWRGAASGQFLEAAAEEVRSAGYRIVNIDATVVLEKIKLGPLKREIAANLRLLLNPYWALPDDAVSVKAKTNEGCDALGRGAAIGAHVAVLLEKVVLEKATG